MKYLIIFLFTAVELNCSIVINEFMPAPVNSEPEWIELFNCGTEAAIFDTLYVLEGSGSKQFISIELEAESYAIITKDTNSLKLHRSIPENCQLIYCKLPALNNTSDQVLLKDKQFNIIDSIYYELTWGKKGFSFERIKCNEIGSYPENLIMTSSIDSATCGYLNNCSMATRDLALENIITDKSGFQFSVVNKGINNYENVQVEISLFDNSEIKHFKTETIPLLKSNISKNFTISNEELFEAIAIKGEHKILIKILNSDDRPENNSIEFNTYLSYDFADILVNEILYDNDNDMSEFIELYNNSGQELSLKNWKYIDYSSSKPDTILICDYDFAFDKGSYIVLISDTTIFTSFPDLSRDKIIILVNKIQLNNSSDKLKITDANGKIIDSVEYSSKWSNNTLFPLKNRSLEKIIKTNISNLSDNWTSSLSDRLSTPAEVNSTYYRKSDGININISKNPFSKSKNSEEQISVGSTFNSAYMTVKLLDLSGRSISEIVNLKVVGAEFSLDVSNEIHSLEIGPYILLIELTDIETGDYKTAKNLLVIAK
jgi:hypothetical protein